MSRFRDALDEVGLSSGEFAIGIGAFMAMVACVIGFAWVVVSGISSPSRDAVSTTHYATSFRQDGHLFIRAFGGGILHHPECACGRLEVAQ